MVESLAYSDEGRYLACGGGNGVLWLLEGLAMRRVKRIIAWGAFRSLRWLATSDRHGGRHGLFCGLSSGHLLVCFIGGRFPNFFGYEIHRSSVQHLKLCNHNQTLVTSTEDQIKIWNLLLIHSNGELLDGIPFINVSHSLISSFFAGTYHFRWKLGRPAYNISNFPRRKTCDFVTMRGP